MAETQDVTLPVLVAVTALPGAMFWRQNCGKFLTPDGKRVVQATSIDGIADIMGHYWGRATAIETKTKRGKLRDTQKKFRDQFTRDGGIYIVARSPDEAISALKSLSPKGNPHERTFPNTTSDNQGAS